MDHQELATGFRFYPTEEELVSFYLNNKLESKREDSIHRVIPDLDIYGIEPWDLPSTSYTLFNSMITSAQSNQAWEWSS